jgi:anthranilate synthase component 1
MKLRPIGGMILLESVESGTILGRYSFIGIQPESRIVVDSERLSMRNGGEKLSIPHEGNSPLEGLRQLLGQTVIEPSTFRSPLLGGAVGYMAYDFVRFFESIPDQVEDDLQLPLAVFHVIDTLLVFDHVKRNMRILSLYEGAAGSGRDAKAAHDKVERVRAALMKPLIVPGTPAVAEQIGPPVSNFTESEFCDAVREVKKHIVAGDVYQQVISQRLHGQTHCDPFLIYRALRMLNPSPYMYFLDFEELKLIGSSPEVLVRLEDDQACVRPIAGTRPRGRDSAEDEALAAELLADEKELAEHVMLVDLGRNDLGRSCEIGTVKVTDFMRVEKYSHVMHMTSNVVGKLNGGMDQFDLFEAAFPAGTLTGAPKIRAMQLIEEIEKTRRGPYGGAVGYFSLSGDMDWCINIRTIIMKGQDYYMQAGAGIVADSVPENEYLETNNKLAALLKAVQMAEGGLQ